MKYLSAITTYNPDPSRLEENLRALLPQTDFLLITDNGSANFADIKALAGKLCHDAGTELELIQNEKNLGVARALWQIMDFAEGNGFDWVLTLDQDSVAAPELIEHYLEYASYPSAGALTCVIKDRNFTESFPDTAAPVDKCITSGCFMSTEAYKKTPGYNPELFIDKVDFDICCALRRAGYEIICVPYEGLLHEVGHAKNVSVAGRGTVVFGQPAWRRWYSARNGIYIARKYGYESTAKALARELKDVLAVFIYEDDRAAKLKAGIKGIAAGFKMKI